MGKVVLTLFVLWFVGASSQDGVIKISNPNYKHSHAKWSPVEDLLLFESDMEGKKSIYCIDSKGENIKRLTSLDHEDWLPSWSPDGRQIAYSSKRNGRYQLFIYDLISNLERPLIISEFSDVGPSWSPDGKQITYSSKLKGGNIREVFVVDVDGKNKKRLTHNKRLNIIPVFSADGKRIFFQSTAYTNNSSKNDVLSFNLSTSKIERITHTDTGGGIDPFVYAPNNKLAFFAGSKAPDGGGTYWMDLETKKMTKFDIKAKTPGHPTWSCDGKYVTIIDRRATEIYVYDIENSSMIQVTDKSKFSSKN